MKTEMDFKKNYIDWLNENIEQCQIHDGVYRITLPFLDRNNDYIEIYITKESDNIYRLTDDGETIEELTFSGLELFKSKRRTAIFNGIIASHGINKSDKNELYTTCTKEDLPQKKHMLSQCMIKVSDLFYTVRQNIQSLFIEDVQAYLDDNDIRYIPSISFVGKSQLTTNYDFGIAKSKNAPERIIKVVNNLDRSKSESTIFLWDDTKEMRKSSDSQLYVFVHDKDKKVQTSAVTALKQYGIKVVLWSNREKYTRELTL